MIARESTSIARATLSLYMKFHGNDSMFPSKMIPTTSAFLLMTGLPELPPIISGVETVSNGVLRSIDDFDFNQLSGSWYGGLLP